MLAARSPIDSACRSIRCRSNWRDVTVRIDAETAEWASDEARASGRPHNEARAVFSEIVTYVLTERAIARIGTGLADPGRPRRRGSSCGPNLLAELADNDAFTAAIDELWPVLTPETLLAVAVHVSPSDCGRRAPTRRSCATTGRPGRCRMCRCSTSWSTCSGRTSRPTTPPSGNERPRRSTPQAYWTSWSAART